ncbi:MAG: thioredoxin-dependent thiol peroxidase [Phormidesmis sp.]
MTLVPGDPAPDFSMPDADDNTISLSDLRGQRVVLFFYPRDNTPGCTKEVCAFRDIYSDLQVKNVAIFGVSTDSAKSHTKFAAKHSLPFPLLVDTDGEVGTRYDCYGLKKMYGKEYMGITRSSFIIGPDGTLEKIYRKVKPEPHVAEVMADVEKLTGDISKSDVSKSNVSRSNVSRSNVSRSNVSESDAVTGTE